MERDKKRERDKREREREKHGKGKTHDASPSKTGSALEKKKKLLLDQQVIALPSACFLAFLALRLRSSTRRLRAARSHMMWAYYCACWAVSLLALLRAVLLTAYVESNFAAGPSSAPPAPAPAPAAAAHATLLNVLWLATRGGLTLLEVSVVVFLAQGFQLGGAAALARTGAVAGAAALLEGAVEASLVFGRRRVPLFLWGGDDAESGDLSSAKWGFWLARSLLFASLYALVLRVPRSARWRDLLPATPAFFRYCSALCGVHASLAAGSLLLLLASGGGGAGGHRWEGLLLSWPGYCLVGAASGFYYGLFPAALYSAFLAAFFADSALDLDLAYYSEMRDAGYFEGGGRGGGGEGSLLGGGGGGGEVGF